MRTRRSAWLRVHRAELAAALVGVLVVLIGAAMLDAGGARPRGEERHGPATRARASADPTPAGAVQAATSYLIVLGAASLGSPQRARRTVNSIATGALKTKLAQALPALAGPLRARVKKGPKPAAFDGWPLGYRVLSFDGSHATVAVWHLDIASSSALPLVSADYATTTYRLRFLAGAWRIAAARTQAGPTPPAVSAPARQLDRFARSVNFFSPYRYVP